MFRCVFILCEVVIGSFGNFCCVGDGLSIFVLGGCYGGVC